MATLKKVVTTHWEDRTGTRVKPGTPGAKKVRVESAKWYVVYKHEGKLNRVPAYTDKAASQKKLADIVAALERGDAKLTDPFKIHLDRPLREHIGDYLEDVRHGGTSTQYHGAVAARLARTFDGIGAKTLRDVTADKLKAFFRTMTDARVKEGSDPVPVSVTTKSDHRAAVYTFFQWLRKGQRHPENVVERVPRAEPPKGEPVAARKRRALKTADLRTLIRTAGSYPVESRKLNRGGRPKSDGSPRAASTTKMKPETVAKLEEQGRERRMMYLLATFTGLRRGELSRVQVKEVKLKKGVIDLPGLKTKNGRRAVIPLVKRLVTELKAWVAEKDSEAPLIAIPDRHNLRRPHLAHLKMANIPYQTDKGHADWHSLRKTVNTFLRRREVPLRQRQRFLRHSAADLATQRYDDERTGDMADVVRELSRLWRFVVGGEAESKDAPSDAV
ncbi:site-specific integrase [Gemmata sp. G18]|uniref:Site-specific integrase n=1 Tax=Gemmata palustris TaxID=2822762 RepID=A0ABS5BL15_9BACT|nr:site-specific integrase [Gemmata palustris]MBP3954360.1 site-specific integrase [Gemmata palustris]